MRNPPTFRRILATASPATRDRLASARRSLPRRTLRQALAFPVALLLLQTLSPPLDAQPSCGGAGSVLVFPLVDSQPASATIVNLTNTNTDTVSCPGDRSFDRGDVRLHYVYFGARQVEIEAGNAVWREFDRIEPLTPGDTLTVLASDHDPEAEVGFLLVQAQDPSSGEGIDFDYLIGSAYVADSNLDVLWSYLPYSFEGNPPGAILPASACGHVRLGSSLDIRFDGVQYDAFPDLLFVDSFFEEAPGIFDNRLVLLSAVDPGYESEVSILIWNNDEDAFSRTLRFRCWISTSLLELSGAAGSLRGDPDEFARETGWVSIDGRRILSGTGLPVGDPAGPPLLGVFMQAIRSDYTAGHQLHFRGSQTNAVLP